MSDQLSETINKLREPKIPLFGKQVAVFDLTSSMLLTYLVVKKMGVENPLIWSPLLGIVGGYVIHKALDVDTPMTRKIDTMIGQTQPYIAIGKPVPTVDEMVNQPFLPITGGAVLPGGYHLNL